MRNKLILFAFLATILLGCGEAGVEVDISKDTEIELSISDLTARDASTRATINLAEDEFDEYLADAENWSVNKIEIQITSVSGRAEFVDVSGINGVAGIELLIGSDVLFETSSATSGFGLFVDTQNFNQLKAGDRILVYDADRPGDQDVVSDQRAIDNLELALQDRLSVGLSLGFIADFIDANIDISIFIDVTVRTQAD